MEENNTMNVKVEKRVTTDLEQTEEAVFEVIALNPDAAIEGIREKYGLSKNRVLEATDNLQRKGFVEAVSEDEHNDCVWKVTELGRLMLLKYVQVMRFDIMEAKLRGQSRSQVEKLEEKKEAFETAYRQCKMLFEKENGGEQ
jgi:DNA-binding PadR family transcriptional regulator